MTFQAEFPNFPAGDMPALPAGFEDTSWHNDMCPCITSDSLHLAIFIDFADASQREIGEDSNRFLVLQLDAEGSFTGEEPLVASDDWNDVLAYIAKVQA